LASSGTQAPAALQRMLRTDVEKRKKRKKEKKRSWGCTESILAEAHIVETTRGKQGQVETGGSRSRSLKCGEVRGKWG